MGADSFDNIRGNVFLALLALQFGLQPILTRSFVPRDTDKPTLVLTCEVVKWALSSIMLLSSCSGRDVLRRWRLRDMVALAVPPAIVFAAQNLCIQLAYQHLDGTTFNLLNQSKIPATALMLFVVMGKRQSKQQCGALALLLIAGFILCRPKQTDQLAAVQTDSSGWNLESERMLLGVLPCLAAAAMSGLASALSQHAMQGKASRDALLLSAELALCTACSITIGVFAQQFNAALEEDQRNSTPGSIINAFGTATAETLYWPVQHLQSLTAWAAVPLLSNALGGVFVGQVRHQDTVRALYTLLADIPGVTLPQLLQATKYAGADRKAFAVIIGIMLTALSEWIVFAKPLASELWVTAPLVVASLFIYNAYPVPQTTKTKTS